MAIKAKYEKLKTKYSLPEYKEINTIFNIEDIDEESELVLVKVRIKIHEKLEYYMKIFESLLQPDSTLYNMYESHYVTDNNKDQIYTLFKKLMYILRRSTLVSVNNTEEGNAEFIKKAYTEWLSLKPDIEDHLNKLSEVWKRETNIRNDSSYFG